MMAQMKLAGFRKAGPSGLGSGFTLLEVLVAVAVVAVLVSILLPSLQRVREDARRTVCLANLKQVGAALFTYAANHAEAGPQVMPPIGKTAPRQLLSHADRLVNLGLLWPRMVADANHFLCPSQSEFSYGGTVARLGRETVAGSYAYAVHIPAGHSPRLGIIRHLAMASDDFTAGPDHWGVGRSSHRSGYNVLYTDGSVTWYADPDQKIWKRKIYWDDETDAVNYDSIYRRKNSTGAYVPASGGYGSTPDLFRVWWSFCYHRPTGF